MVQGILCPAIDVEQFGGVWGCEASTLGGIMAIGTECFIAVYRHILPQSLEVGEGYADPALVDGGIDDLCHGQVT